MYPKDQVYPPGGGELQLEQLRAALPQYRYRPPEEKQDEMACDMEMTTAYPGNITELVPVVPSAERGKKVLLERKPLKELKKRRGESDDVDEEFERLFTDHPSTPPPVQLEVDPIEQQMEQLMLERERESYQLQPDVRDKENLPVASPKKNMYQFTPSMTEDRSVTARYG